MQILATLSHGSSGSRNSTFFKAGSSDDVAFSISNTTDETGLLSVLTRTEEEEMKTSTSYKREIIFESEIENFNQSKAAEQSPRKERDQTSLIVDKDFKEAQDVRKSTSGKTRNDLNGDDEQIGSRGSTGEAETTHEDSSGKLHPPKVPDKTPVSRRNIKDTVHLKKSPPQNQEAFGNSRRALRDFLKDEKGRYANLTNALNRSATAGIAYCRSSRGPSKLKAASCVDGSEDQSLGPFDIKPIQYDALQSNSKQESYLSESASNDTNDGLGLVDCIDASKIDVKSSTRSMIKGIFHVEEQIIDYFEPLSLKNGSHLNQSDLISNKGPDLSDSRQDDHSVSSEYQEQPGVRAHSEGVVGCLSINHIEEQIIDYFEPESLKNIPKSNQGISHSKRGLLFKNSRQSNSFTSEDRELLAINTDASVDVRDGPGGMEIEKSRVDVARYESTDPDSNHPPMFSSANHGTFSSILFTLLPPCCRMGIFEEDKYGPYSNLSKKDYRRRYEEEKILSEALPTEASFNLSSKPSIHHKNEYENKNENIDTSQRSGESESIAIEPEGTVYGLRNVGALISQEDETEEIFVNDSNVMKQNRVYQPTHKGSNLAIKRKQKSLAKKSAASHTNWMKIIYGKRKSANVEQKKQHQSASGVRNMGSS